MNAEERYRNEAHVLTRERDEALAEAKRLRTALTMLDELAERSFRGRGVTKEMVQHIVSNVLAEEQP